MPSGGLGDCVLRNKTNKKNYFIDKKYFFLKKTVVKSNYIKDNVPGSKTISNNNTFCGGNLFEIILLTESFLPKSSLAS